MMNFRLLSRELRAIADRIDKGTCAADDEELVALGALLLHRKMNIEQVCQRCGISRATLNRWQQKGKLPLFRKDSGGKDYLYQDEIEEALQRWAIAHPNE